MSCPTCGHTLQGIGYGMFHCPRCGTLVNCPTNGAVHAPALVNRCREFQEAAGPDWFRDWLRLGIAEAIRPPGDRPKEGP